MKNRIRRRYYVAYCKDGKKILLLWPMPPDLGISKEKWVESIARWYTSIVGPFQTKSGAEVFARIPEPITMKMAENIARSIRKYGIVKEDA